MTPVYMDTGLVLKLIIEEPLSPAVHSFLQQKAIPVAYSWLVELETNNALQAKLFRKEISKAELKACLDLISQLKQDGRFMSVKLPPVQVIQQTLAFTASISSKTGCRTLDLMHIASAHLLGWKDFASSDKRQLLAAKSAGLHPIDLNTWQPN